MCESQSEKAFNEKLARSQQISGQVSQVSLQPMPFVLPPKKVLSAKGKRKRLIFYMLALCFAIPAVGLIFSPFISAYIIAGVPGDHGDSGDALAWMPIGAFMSIVPIGFAVLVFALTMFGLGRGVSR